MRVFLIGDTRAQNNWGCRATTLALLGLIEEFGGEIAGRFITHSTDRKSAFSGLALSVVDRPRLYSSVLAAKRLRNVLRAALGAFEFSTNGASAFSRHLDKALSGRTWKSEVSRMLSADVVVANGEGAIYGREKKGLETLFLCALAKRLDKKCLLINHTAELNDPVMLEIAEHVYPQLDDVLFREPISAREFRHLCKNSDNCEAPDAAFLHRPFREEIWQEYLSCPGALSIFPYTVESTSVQSPYICITGSSAYLRSDRHSLPPFAAYERLVDTLRQAGFGVLLVAPDATDEAFLRIIASKKSVPLIPASAPLPLAINVLSRAACLVGGRWHPSILASLGGCPSVSFTANTKKTTALLEMLGIDGPTFDAFGIDDCVPAIADLALAYAAEGRNMRNKVQTRARELGVMARMSLRSLQSHDARCAEHALN